MVACPIAPVKFCNGPLAGCNGFGTNWVMGFKVPLLATYCGFHSASTEAGTFCWLWNTSFRLDRFLLLAALYPAETNHLPEMAFSTKKFHCFDMPFFRWRSNRASETP